ncbi:MAG: anaerobic ribonucleoside-triphosphate reductase activating protein [Desulfuromonadales bacterium]|nr:anaerobic ribonucleoside-triphosphate reductase activating protein [Desulfuromonadales bacterium]NIS42967.1 anaerobic ribonucleoside-triphosphate reductase activating protein [Desulfuromonadales bacterium]
MPIKGFQGTSLLDFPGRIAALVFFGGCNLTCPFCHNPSLVLGPDDLPDYPVDALLADLGRRRSFIDGVVVSGGEPTLDPHLPDLLREIKTLGLSVKVDTNALLPDALQRLIDEQLVDFLAVDLKTSLPRYGELHAGPVDIDALRQGLQIVLDAPVDHEFRTTCVPGFVERDDILSMAAEIKGARRWVLQQFVASHALDEHLREIEPHPAATVRGFADLAEGTVDEVAVRGL